VNVILGLILSSMLSAGLPDISAVQDTIPVYTPADSLLKQLLTPPTPRLPEFSNFTMVTQEPEEVPDEEIPDTVHVWEYDTPTTLEKAETDSTLRWLDYVNMAERFYRQKGAVTYRLGTNGRMDGV